MPQWDRELRASGFTGIDLAFDDFPGSDENHFASLLVSSSAPSVLLANIEKSLRNFFRGASGAVDYERELVQIGDLLHIPRVYQYNSLNGQVHEATRLDLVERQQRFGEQNLTLKVRRPGLLDRLY